MCVSISMRVFVIVCVCVQSRMVQRRGEFSDTVAANEATPPPNSSQVDWQIDSRTINTATTTQLTSMTPREWELLQFVCLVGETMQDESSDGKEKEGCGESEEEAEGESI